MSDIISPSFAKPVDWQTQDRSPIAQSIGRRFSTGGEVDDHTKLRYVLDEDEVLLRPQHQSMKAEVEFDTIAECVLQCSLQKFEEMFVVDSSPHFRAHNRYEITEKTLWTKPPVKEGDQSDKKEEDVEDKSQENVTPNKKDAKKNKKKKDKKDKKKKDDELTDTQPAAIERRVIYQITPCYQPLKLPFGLQKLVEKYCPSKTRVIENWWVTERTDTTLRIITECDALDPPMGNTMYTVQQWKVVRKSDDTCKLSIAFGICWRRGLMGGKPIMWKIIKRSCSGLISDAINDFVDYCKETVNEKGKENDSPGKMKNSV